MDRQISKEQIKKEKRQKWIKIGLAALVSLLLIALLIRVFRPSISNADLRYSQAESGTVEAAISASGRISPAFEESITAPIESRIQNKYHNVGDTVTEGSPLLQLDLQGIETNYKKMLDELQMKRYKLDQLRIQTASEISNREMQVKVSKMQLSKMEVEVKNEKYLDSIGAGTTDKVREVQLRYEVAKLEQDQALRKIKNDKALAESQIQVATLELSIFQKSLNETKRLLEDAHIRAPRGGVLTYLNEDIGAQVSKGTLLAILSDLSHFKVFGEVSDSYANKIQIGARAIVRVGKESLQGVLDNITPLSKNGVIKFSVKLDDDANPVLRSGLKTDVDILCAIKENVLRISNGSYYSGAGKYELFVKKGKLLERREVQLGESNYKYVEVISGLKAGEEVVTSDMSKYKEKSHIKINE